MKISLYQLMSFTGQSPLALNAAGKCLVGDLVSKEYDLTSEDAQRILGQILETDMVPDDLICEAYNRFQFLCYQLALLPMYSTLRDVKKGVPTS